MSSLAGSAVRALALAAFALFLVHSWSARNSYARSSAPMPVFERLAQLAGAGLFLAAGAALVQLLPALRALPLGRRLAHAYLLGVAWLAGGLYALSYFFAVPLRPPAILAVAAAPVL